MYTKRENPYNGFVVQIQMVMPMDAQFRIFLAVFISFFGTSFKTLIFWLSSKTLLLMQDFALAM